MISKIDQLRALRERRFEATERAVGGQPRADDVAGAAVHSPSQEGPEADPLDVALPRKVAAFDRKAYQRSYMREWRVRRR